MEYWKNNKDKNINKIENILDDDSDVFSGGWIDRNLFQKYNEYVKAENGELYIRGGPRFHMALDNLRIKACIITCGGLSPVINVVIRE